MKLSGQKFAAICRKYNLPKYETTGFSFNSYSQEISYNSGRNRLSLRKELDLFVLMANALMNEGFDVFYGQQSYSKSPIFKMELFGNVFEYRSADVFKNAFEEFCIEDDAQRQEEEYRKNQKMLNGNEFGIERLKLPKNSIRISIFKFSKRLTKITISVILKWIPQMELCIFNLPLRKNRIGAMNL